MTPDMGMMAQGQDQENISANEAPLRFGVAALLLGNLALAFGPWFVRMSDTGPVAAAFWRVAIAAPFLFLLARRFGAAGRRPDGRLLSLFAVAGLVFAADLAAWHIGIFYTKLANSNLLGNSTSFLLPLWAFASSRSWPNRREGSALIIAGIGALLLMGQSFELSPQNLLGDLLCLLAGVFYTGYLVLMARARGDAGPLPTLAWVTLTSGPPLLVFAWVIGEQIMPSNWTPLLMLALLSQIIGQGLMIYAIGRVSALLFGLILLLQPLVAAVIGWFAYGERLGVVDWIGASLIGIALVLVRKSETNA